MSEIQNIRFRCKCCDKIIKIKTVGNERKTPGFLICGECAEYYRRRVSLLFMLLTGIAIGILFSMILEDSKLRDFILLSALLFISLLYIIFMIFLKRRGKGKFYTEEQINEIKDS